MPTPRRIFAVFAALSLAAALVGGCSSSSKGSNKPLPDAANLVKQSSQTTKNLKSVHLELSVTGTIEHLPIKTLSGVLTTTPHTAAQGNGTITLGGSDYDAQFVVFGGDLYAKLGGDQWGDFGPAAKFYDPSMILNPDTGLANTLANLSDPKAEGREKIGDQDTIRVSGTVSADTVNKLVPQLKATNAQPTTVWIQENGDHELVQAKLDQGGGKVVQMTLSKWNEPVTVDKPPVGG